MRLALALAACLAAAYLLLRPSPGVRVIELPAGTVEIDRPVEITGSHVWLRGARTGTVLRASPGFRAQALVVCRGCSDARLSDFTLDGNRAALETRAGLPPSNVPFARFTTANGVLIENANRVRMERLQLREVAGFAVLVSRSREVRVAGVAVRASGGRNAAGRNNTTGGILFEEGTAAFQVTGCRLEDIRGNGIWTHSLYTSPRNRDGVIAGNRFRRIGRDAIQVGHATAVRVESNQGEEIGFPLDDVDVEGRAIPVAIDTAGNTDRSLYRANSFFEVNGKCIDLDGFHAGAVERNVCINARPPETYPQAGYGLVMNNTNPDMQSRGVHIVENEIRGWPFGGIFVIGEGNTVARNCLSNLNTAHCNENAARFGCYYLPGEPALLETGIYLGRRAERPAPARGNVIEDNEISGYKMSQRCIAAAPGIAPGDNVVRGNVCRDE